VNTVSGDVIKINEISPIPSPSTGKILAEVIAARLPKGCSLKRQSSLNCLSLAIPFYNKSRTSLLRMRVLKLGAAVALKYLVIM
jgi:hypothetical protein